MAISKDELKRFLAMWNPWWASSQAPDVEKWRRAAWLVVRKWLTKPRATMALLLAGPRRVGKTTLLMQQISQLIQDGVTPRDILYVSFDNDEANLAGFEAILEAWEEGFTDPAGVKYILFDETQYLKQWGTKIKNLVDRKKKTRRIVFTGSALPLSYRNIESGVGRWSESLMGTMSFYEYLFANDLLREKPLLPSSLEEMFGWNKEKFDECRQLGVRLQSGFNRYLTVGGYPELLEEETWVDAQKKIRTDVIDRTLAHDVLNPSGSRNTLPVKAAFNYFCMNDGGILNKARLEVRLSLSQPKVNEMVNDLESSRLITLLPGFSRGKAVLTARSKVYVADHAIRAALEHLGDKVLNDPSLAGHTVETMVFNHLRPHAAATGSDIAYWMDSNGHEVDFLLLHPTARRPIEVKYRSGADPRELKGLRSYHEKKGFQRGYLITKSLDDFGPMTPIASPGRKKGHVMMIPAPLFCYWMGLMQLHGDAEFRL